MSGKNPLPREQAYEGVRAVNPPDIISSVRNPNANDKSYPIGTFWINTSTHSSFQLVAAPGVWSPVAQVLPDVVTTLEVLGVSPTTTSLAVDQGDVVITDGDLALNGFDALLQVTHGNLLVNSGDIQAGGNISAGLLLESTAGIVTDGNLTVGTDIFADGDIGCDGNLSTNSNFSINSNSGKMSIRGGSVLSSLGNVTLVGGSATILNTSVTATDRVFLSYSSASGTQGFLRYTINVGVSLVITSSSVADTSSVSYFIIRQI